MNIYTQFATPEALISPINGYVCKKLTKKNIKKFGFDSLEHLHSLYPNFPTACTSINNDKAAVVCVFCDKQCKNLNSKLQHERRCLYNKDRITMSDKQKDAIKKSHKTRITKNDYIVAKENGITDYKRPAKQRTPEQLKKHQEAIEKRKDYWTPERRAEQSVRMKGVVARNPDSYSKNNVCGRTKLYHYNGHNLKGTWELLTAKWLDQHNISWEYESYSEPYTFKDVQHTYFPDFYLPNYDLFIEVKGYITKRDHAKWQCFSRPLIVFNKPLINLIKKDCMTIERLVPLVGLEPTTNGL